MRFRPMVLLSLALVDGLSIAGVTRRAPTIIPAPRALPVVCKALPSVSLEYCTRCNWMLRSAWMAQELLTTFNGTIGSVTLVPNHEGTGTFECSLLSVDGEEFLLWSRSDEGRFPEAKECACFACMTRPAAAAQNH